MNTTTSTDFSASELQTIRDALHGKIASEFEHCKAMGQTTSDDLSALDTALDHVNEAIRTTPSHVDVVAPEATCTVPWCDLDAGSDLHRWAPDGPRGEWRMHSRTISNWQVSIEEHRSGSGGWMENLYCDRKTNNGFTEPQDALDLASELHEVAKAMEDARATMLGVPAHSMARDSVPAFDHAVATMPAGVIA